MSFTNWLKATITFKAISCNLDTYVSKHNPTTHAQVEILTREFFGD